MLSVRLFSHSGTTVARTSRPNPAQGQGVPDRRLANATGGHGFSEHPGASDGTRTHGIQDHNLALYHLSYARHQEGRDLGDRPARVNVAACGHGPAHPELPQAKQWPGKVEATPSSMASNSAKGRPPRLIT